MRHHAAWPPVLVVALASVLLASCSDSPTGPTPPPPTLRITCPANIEVASLDGQPAAVSYDPPKTEGGTAPVSSACLPPSGSAFPVGSTQVRCTATDSASRTASCSFTATVRMVPQVAATRYLAFGDSITEGVVSPPLPTVLVADPSQSYPTKLHALLAGRYVAQTIVVFNAGKSGEKAVDGEKRLPDVLDDQAPEVLLLLEGANDLNAYKTAGIPRASMALEEMVKEGQRSGARVYLATLPPWRAGPPRNLDTTLPVLLNEEIASVARAKGADLVDLYAGMVADIDRLIGQDGLHPTEAGYERMAEIFFDALRLTLETPAPQGVTSTAR